MTFKNTFGVSDLEFVGIRSYYSSHLMARQISEERINVFQIAPQCPLCEYTTPQAHRHVCNSDNMDTRG